MKEETLRVACPDMDPAVEALPTLMRRLYKSSEPQYERGTVTDYTVDRWD